MHAKRTGRAGVERGWRLTFKRILMAARAVSEGEMTPEEAASRFTRSPGAQEARQWAADYRLLDEVSFRAKYDSRRGKAARAGRPGEFDYDDVPAVLRKSIARLEVEERRLQEELEALRAKLVKARKHLEFAESGG